MKKVFVLVIICIVLTGTGLADLNDGLLAYWSFDEGMGSIAYDSADGYNGTIYGASWTPGVIGSSLSFDGTNDYVHLPKLILDDFTVAFWVNTTQVAPNSSAWWNGYGLVDAEKCEYLNDWGTALTADRAAFGIGGSTSEWVTIKSTSIINDGKWYFITAMRDKDTGQIALFVNGERESQGVGITDTLSQIDYIGVGNNACDVRDGDEWFRGLIDEVRIYDRVLSEEEIGELYLLGLPVLTDLCITGPNEVAEDSSAQYTATAIYSDESTEDVTDSVDWAVEPNDDGDINSSGLLTTYESLMPSEDVTVYAQYEEGNDVFRAKKDVQIFALCPQGSALKFDGVNDKVDCGDPEDGSLDFGTNDFTVAAWVYFNSDYRHKIVTKVETYSNLGWSLRVDYVGLQFILNDTYAVTSTPPSIGNWHHIAGVRNNGWLSLYVDSRKVAAAELSASVNVSSDYPLYIGSRFGSPPIQIHQGKIDEVAIYNKALDSAEVSELMCYGPDLDDPYLAGYWNFDEGSGQVAKDLSGRDNDAYLGSDPCGPDAADPCWVEPGAPAPCTREGFIERNLRQSLSLKAGALEMLAKAIEKEWIAKNALEVYFDNRDFGNSSKSDVVRAKQRIQQSIQQEEQAQSSVQQSVEDLNDSMDSLGIE